jgi:excisionase family DNA binding protein
MTAGDETYLAPSVIAKRLGCSTQHVRHLIYRGELPGARFGGILRVRQRDLEAYERAARISPAEGTETAPPIAPAPKAPLSGPTAPDWETMKQSLKRSLRSTARFWSEPRLASTPKAVGRTPSLPPNPVLAKFYADARYGIALLRHKDIAAAIVQWPVIYPRWITREQKHYIASACSHCGIFVQKLAIPRGIGGRAPDDPELLAALDTLRDALGEGECKLSAR